MSYFTARIREEIIKVLEDGNFESYTKIAKSFNISIKLLQKIRNEYDLKSGDF